MFTISRVASVTLLPEHYHKGAARTRLRSSRRFGCGRSLLQSGLCVGLLDDLWHWTAYSACDSVDDIIPFLCQPPPPWLG